MSSKQDKARVYSFRGRPELGWHIRKAAKAAGLKQADYLRQTIEKAVKPPKVTPEPQEVPS